MYNEKTGKIIFNSRFAVDKQRVQHKILTSEYIYLNRREK